MAGYSSGSDRPDTTRPVAVIHGQAPESVKSAVAAALQQIGHHVSDADTTTQADLHCFLLWGNSAWGGNPAPVPLPESVLEQASRPGTRPHRLVLITDYSPSTVTRWTTDEAARWNAELGRWHRITALAAGNGVAANTIRIGYSPELGHQMSDEEHWSVHRRQVLRRPATRSDLANALRVLTGAGTAYLSGETLALDGGLDAGFIPSLVQYPGAGWHHRAAEIPEAAALGSVLVTGASSGVGAATVEALARRGVDTVIVGRNHSALEAVADAGRRLGASVQVCVADLAGPDGARQVAEEAWGTHRVSQLCYCAGLLYLDQPRDPERNGEQRDRMWQVNVRSFANMADHLVANWIQAGVAGAITSVSSVTAGLAPLSHSQSYASTKAAGYQFTQALANTVSRYGIRANSVRAGIIDTPMGDTAGADYKRAWLDRIPMNSVGDPSELAELLCDLLSPESSYVTGTQMFWDGGLHLNDLPGRDARPGFDTTHPGDSP